jgi:hypothetical protein
MYGEAIRVFAVMALVCVAACLATPPGKLPLALRGIRKMLRKDLGVSGQTVADAKAPVWRRMLSFLLVIVAALVALA